VFVFLRAKAATAFSAS